MINLKKLYGDELLRLALIFSLLKVDPDEYMQETQQLIAGLNVTTGPDWSLEHEARAFIRPRQLHPKALDTVILNYERNLFDELNSLGHSDRLENNGRMWNNRGPIHTYLLNVATETVVSEIPEAVEQIETDRVASDDNVSEEVNFSATTSGENDAENTGDVQQSDVVVTLAPGFTSNRSEIDIFDEIITRSFDIEEFFLEPGEMHIKKEPDYQEQSSDKLLDFSIKKESYQDDLYSDNAIDDYVPFFSSKIEKENEDPQSILDQNIADLKDYGEIFDFDKLKNDLSNLDSKSQHEDLNKFLLENTPLDVDDFQPAPMFEEEFQLDSKRERASTSFTSASSSGVSEMDNTSVEEVSDVKTEPDEGNHSSEELTQEDMNLIEVLWKQDVDMGFTLEPLIPSQTTEDCPKIEADGKHWSSAEGNTKLDYEEALQPEDVEEDPWAGLSYTVDTETGEYLRQELKPEEDACCGLLEEALQLVQLGEDAKHDQQAVDDGMLHPAMRPVPHHHPLAHYHNQSLMRSMSAEQRWQDLASLLSIPPPPPPADAYQHYHHQHNVSGHGGAVGYAPNYHHPVLPPPPDKYPDHYAGAAAPTDGAFKMESAHHPQPHDAIYYQNSTAEMAAPATDGFLQSILNDEDLQLMDMAVNEGMYTMRMLDGGGAPAAPAATPAPPHHHLAHTHMMLTERDSGSDSAVSSMGSERVPSLSDGEWCDGSDSAQDYHSTKFRPYESGYARERAMQPQKKHHMFGKRCFQEQHQLEGAGAAGARAHPVKFECEQSAYHHDMRLHNDYSRGQLAPPHLTSLHPPLDINAPHSSHTMLQGARHNHTYSVLPPDEPRAQAARDKRVRKMTDGSISDGGSSTGHHFTRDEKRAKALGIPLEVSDIINLPMDEFNERLSKHDLSEAQLSLIRDIRRRGKNKVAAQNCRKRKLDQITCLADEVRAARERRQRAQHERRSLLAARQRLKEKFAALYAHVFQNLRDADGREVSPARFSLQQAADGNVVLVPRPHHHAHDANNQMNRPEEDLDRKPKDYEP